MVTGSSYKVIHKLIFLFYHKRVIERSLVVGLIKKFKEFLEKRRKKTFEKNTKLIKNAKAMKDDRAAAIDYMASVEDSYVAIKALLQRFDYSLEHGINDSREKQKVMDIIIAFGDKAVTPVLEHLSSSPRIAWPVKIISSLMNEKELVQALNSALSFGDIDFDQEIVDKNYDILCYLRNYHLNDKGKQIFQYLEAHDERLRFAAVEVLLSQDDEENYVALEKFLLDNSPENIRIKQSVAKKFIESKRKLHDVSLFKVGFLHPDLVIRKDYTLKYADD